MLDRVLVVDSAEITHVALRNLLEQRGVRGHYERSVASGLQRLVGGNYALVAVGEAELPEFMRGFAIPEPRPPVFLLRARKAGSDDTKPSEEVFDILERPYDDREEIWRRIQVGLRMQALQTALVEREREAARLRVELDQWRRDAADTGAESVASLKHDCWRQRARSAMQTELLAGICHELRSPLVSVRGYTELFYRGHLCPIPPEYLRYLEASLRNVDKLQALIESLSRHAEIARNTCNMAVERFDFAEVAGQAVVRVTERHGLASGAVTLKLPGRRLEVNLDGMLAGSALDILLDNALRRGGGAAELSVSILTADSFKVNVRDGGPSIPPDEHQLVFDTAALPDSLLPESARKYVGLGLARDRLRLLGAELRFGCDDARGVTFYFNLRLASDC